MRRKRSLTIIIISLIGLLTFVSGLLSNFAATALTPSIKPYLPYTTPLLIIITIILVGLALWQFHLNTATGDSDNAKEQINNSFSVEHGITALIQKFFSGYRRHYQEFLFNRHRDFDIKGLSTQGIHTLDLEQVFVELSIDQKPVHQMSPNPIEIPDMLRSGGHVIWDYLATAQLANQHFAVIGAPGCGKTTLLKHITLILVAPQKYQQSNRIQHRLPILLFLRDHANMLNENPDFSLVDALRIELKKAKQKIPTSWIENQLAKGRCLVMLDGLDEVADLAMRQKVVNWVEQQMVAYAKNRFIITSRPFGYRSNPLSRVTVLQVHSFTPKQVKQFVHKWYLAQEIMSSHRDDPLVRVKANDNSEDLLRRLRSTPAIFALAVNPLLLTMITTIHRYLGTLPDRRVSLYAEICEVFLGKRQQARGLIFELSPAQKQLVLQPLAYYMMCKEMREITFSEAETVIKAVLLDIKTDISPKVFLQMIENMSGVLLEREQGVYSFAHLSFQEYLAAAHVKENNLEADLVTRVEASWWHETIRLYCGQSDASSIIRTCLAKDHLSITALTLSLECQKEAFKIQPEVNDQLNALIEYSVEDADPEKRSIVAKALLAQRVSQMIHIDGETYADTSLLNCAEYQVFLDKQQAHGAYHQPDHWKDFHFPTSQGKAPVLGVRQSDASAFCAWLTQQDPGIWRYRLPKSGEFENEIWEGKGSIRLAVGTGFWLDEDGGFSRAEYPIPLFGRLIKDQFFLVQYRTDSIAKVSFLLQNRYGNLERSIIRARKSISEHNYGSSTLALVESRNSVLSTAHELEQTNFTACNDALDLAIDFDLIDAYIRNRAYPLNLDHLEHTALAISNYSIIVGSIEYGLAKSLAQTFSDNLTRSLDRSVIENPFHRISILDHTSNTAFDLVRVLNSIRFQKADNSIQDVIDSYLDAYVILTALKERAKSNLPVCEGILSRGRANCSATCATVSYPRERSLHGCSRQRRS